jgi:hypothetical protein
MGFNSTLVVLNDGLNEIRDDKEFGRKVHDAILQHDRYKRSGQINDISSGCHANVASVVDVHHADETAVIAVGGNCGTVLTTTWEVSHHEDVDKERIVRKMAEELGYDLRKKPQKRKVS